MLRRMPQSFRDGREDSSGHMGRHEQLSQVRWAEADPASRYRPQTFVPLLQETCGCMRAAGKGKCRYSEANGRQYANFMLAMTLYRRGRWTSDSLPAA